MTTSFNEDVYTTKLDKSSALYKQNETRAARLAQEITKETSSNVHIASDRGLDLEVDEETLYGAVIRSAEPTTYVPPGKRSKGRKASTRAPSPVPSPAAKEAPIKSQSPAKSRTASKPPPQANPSPDPSPAPVKEVEEAKPAPVDPLTVSQSSSSTLDAQKMIGDLYCAAMERRMRVDPSKASTLSPSSHDQDLTASTDTAWKGVETRGSYLIVEQSPRSPQSFNPYAAPASPVMYNPYQPVHVPYGYPPPMVPVSPYGFAPMMVSFPC